MQLQYLSCGNILDTKYYKTRKNYDDIDNKWCFNYNSSEDDMDADCTRIAFGSFGQHYTSIYKYTNNNNGYSTSDYKKKDWLRKKEFIISEIYK